ncbi:MAG TPA: TraR/DksA C4-type zinc finger protein [Acidimicrobiales bacterium]|nr:TraR/DksA C4-type zinc finger protein [Acidimicrobiales bacterium]
METETGTDTGAAPVEPAPVEPAPVEPADVDAVEALLDQVDGALARLDDGSYGRCESCGTIIADERLAEIPTARTCAACPVPVPVIG